MARMVQCAKLGRLLPGLDEPPISGELGQRIYEHISKEAWDLWGRQMTMLINHYRISPIDPEGRKFLRQQMEEFFFGEGARMPEEWVPPGAAGGKGKGGITSAQK